MSKEKISEKKEGTSRRTFLMGGVAAVVGAVAGFVGGQATAPTKEVIKEIPGKEVLREVSKEMPMEIAIESGHPLETWNSDEIALYYSAELAKDAPSKTIQILMCEGTTAQVDWLIPIWKEKTGIDVKYITAPLYDLPTKTIEEAVAKSGVYDACVVECEYIADVVESGMAINLDPYIEKYKTELFNWPSPFSGGHYQKVVQYNGKNYQIIWDGCLWNPFYRSDYLDDPDEQSAFARKYGYTLPTWGADTWQQLYDMMEFFHRPNEPGGKNEKLTGLSGILGGWWFRTKEESSDIFLIRHVSNGGTYFDDNMNAAIDSAEGVAALEALKNETKFLPEIAISGTWTDMYADFPAGKTFSAFSWTSLGKWSTSAAIKGLYKLGKVPGTIIQGKNRRVTIRRGTLSWLVSNYSKIPDITFLFMQYMTSPRVSSICISKTGYWDPARENHFTYPEVLAIYGTAQGIPTEQVQTSLYNNRLNQTVCMPNLLLVRYGEYQKSLTDAVHGYITGTISTPTAALKQAADTWNTITEDVGKDQQLARYNNLKKSFPPDIRELHGW